MLVHAGQVQRLAPATLPYPRQCRRRNAPNIAHPTIALYLGNGLGIGSALGYKASIVCLQP